MKILAIDTTTLLGSIALVDDKLLVGSMQLGTSVTYAERLIVGIDHLLQGARWSRNDIDLIAVARGPGSFTGLRIGIATAKGFAAVLGRPLAGASSLEILARGVGPCTATVVAVIDARRGEVYAAAYGYERGTASRIIMDECVLSPAALCEKLDSMPGDLVMVGDGARRYGELFVAAVGSRLVPVDDALNFPHAVHCARLGYEGFMRGDAGDAVSLVPNYVRVSDAEIGFH